MLLQMERQAVQTNGLLQTAKASIKSTPRIFSFFADGIYGNKKVAVLRELVANAVDAHVMAGKPNTPVRVKLPTTDDPTVMVSDEGIGMSSDFMLNDFMRYTEASTKTQSNDQIGAFGVGSKSPLAIVDQFTIISTHNGLRSTYVVFKDEDLIPSIGLLAQEQTSDDNGVTIMFAPDDLIGWEDAAKQALSYFNPLPVGCELTPPQYVAQDETWGIRAQQGNPGVIMGGIYYPVDPANFDYDTRSTAIFRYGIDLVMPIGSCSVALSREALSYDEATKASIKLALRQAEASVVEKISTMFDQYPTLFEAKLALAKELTQAGPRAQFLRENARYKGEKLDPWVRTSEPVMRWVIETRRKGIGAQAYSRAALHFDPAKTDLIVNDGCDKPVARLIHNFGNRYRDKIILVVLKDELHHLGEIPRQYYKLLSELEAPPPVKRERRETIRWYQPNRYYSGDSLLRSSYRDAIEGVVPENLILVESDSFNIGYLASIWGSGLIQRNEIAIVNKSDLRKIKGLRRIEDVFPERLKAALAETQGLPEYLALSRERCLSSIFQLLNTHRDALGQLTKAQQSRPFGKIVDLYDTYMANQPSTKLARWVEPKLPPRVNPQRLVDAIEPKAKTLLNMLSYRSSPDQVRLLLEFI